MKDIKFLFHIDAPRQKVYNAISSIDGLSKWWTKQTSGESSLNGVIEFRFGELWMNKMKVVKLKKDELVGWECLEGGEEWIGSRVNFKLDENEGKTRLKFEHTGVKGPEDYLAMINFSWSRYLDSLKQLCQTGKGEGFGSVYYRP
jgi:uncharacterized protein YndB with AHSA1/START domain